MHPKHLIKFFTSLRLTVVLLAFSIILIWVGTVAQADEGLYQAQTRYFKQWIVVGISSFGHHVPIVLPGGYLLGSMLLVNLVAAHVYRFRFTTKKLGIQLAHGGIILLLVGQLVTDMFARESILSFSEGQTKSYVESPSNYELVFMTSADDKHNDEVTVPGRMIEHTKEIKSPALPFIVRVKTFSRNSRPMFRAPMMKSAGEPITTNGIGATFDFAEQAEARSMEDRNIPTALLEFVTPSGSLGTWVASAWAADGSALEDLANQYVRDAGQDIARNIIGRLTAPQTVTVNGRAYTFVLRPERVSLPFSVTLLKAANSFYLGSDIPKDYRSRVRIVNPQTHEDREVEIFMNNPLRYSGLTFYQAFMGANMADGPNGVPWSALQVVHNPGWVTPYVGCGLVAAGLLVQFLSHLIGFISKRKLAPVERTPRGRGNAESDPKPNRASREAVPATKSLRR